LGSILNSSGFFFQFPRNFWKGGILAENLWPEAKKEEGILNSISAGIVRPQGLLGGTGGISLGLKKGVGNPILGRNFPGGVKSLRFSHFPSF